MQRTWWSEAGTIIVTGPYWCQHPTSIDFVTSLKNRGGQTNYQGFPTWVSKAYERAKDYNIDLDGSVLLTTQQYKSLCFERTKSSFVTNWNADFREKKTLLRSYRFYKAEFNTDCYLECINVAKYRIPVSKIRASSHDLEIERARYTRPRLDPNHRLCSTCLEVEDEEHFVTSCRVNINERQSLFTKISSKAPTF